MTFLHTQYFAHNSSLFPCPVPLHWYFLPPKMIVSIFRITYVYIELGMQLSRSVFACHIPWVYTMLQSLGMEVHTCNSSPGEVEAGRSEVQGHLWLHELKASLGYTKLCLHS